MWAHLFLLYIYIYVMRLLTENQYSICERACIRRFGEETKRLFCYGTWLSVRNYHYIFAFLIAIFTKNDMPRGVGERISFRNP